MSDPPWHEQVLLISQSRQIEWRGGGRNILTQRQIAGGSRNEPGQREWEVFYSERFVQCPGERSLPHTVTPWFPRLWLCYETCESTRTEQTSHDCFSTQSLSQSSQLSIFRIQFSLCCLYIGHFVFWNTNDNVIVSCNLTCSSRVCLLFNNSEM